MFFIDETGFNCSMRRRFGRAQSGERAICPCAYNKFKKLFIYVQFIIFHQCLHLLFKGGLTTLSIFWALCGTPFQISRTKYLNAILVMDNVPFHHSQSVCTFVERAGHQIKFLPPYSPFLNPIENAFNQWKTWSNAPSPQMRQPFSIQSNHHAT